VNYSHADQGVIVLQKGPFQVEPYVAINTTKDTKGLPWDNKFEAEAGVKTNLNFRHGVITTGAAYAYEKRSGGSKSNPIVFNTGWFGWKQPLEETPRRKFTLTAPGSTWWSLGNTSPFDGKKDIIGVAHIEQGVTVLKTKHVALVPKGAFNIGYDTLNHPWNNRATLGGGLQVLFPMKTSAISFTAGYECTDQLRGTPTSPNACGPAAHIDLWTGWKNMFGGKK
jgi:hypothetical protein